MKKRNNAIERKSPEIFMTLVVNLVMAFFFLTGIGSSVYADDWPQWRGPMRDGIWREQGIIDRFPAGGPPVRWRAPIGPGYSGPAVAGGRVFILDRVPSDPNTEIKVAWNMRNKSTDQERVICLEETTGKVLWTHVYPCDYSCAYGIGPRSTPTVQDGRVYTLGAMGDFYCLDAITGRVVWQKQFVKDLGAEVPLYGFVGQSLVEGDKLITLVGGKGQTVMAFDRRTGKEIWKSVTASEPGFCPPMIFTLAGQRQLVVWHADGLSGIEPESGRELWTIPVPNRVGMAIATPAVEGNRLAISGQYSGSIMFEFKAGTAVPTVVWNIRPSDMPEKTPRKAGFNTTISPLLLFGNHVYGISLYGEMCCLKGDTGERVWMTLQPTSGGTQSKDRWSSAFMVMHGGRVFLFNEKGNLIIARLSPAGYEELDRTHLLDPDMPASNSGRKVIWSHPAFANRCIYARNNHELICVSMAAAER
ncbi:MAG: PQQ-like beta-propeller repeat protein [Kiritimatiellae bacterium]|nr:PQQ-like beta-propeller repeat protein [Kiritimatiellia bacterium]